MEYIKGIENENFALGIFYDTDIESPRKYSEPLGTLVIPATDFKNLNEVDEACGDSDKAREISKKIREENGIVVPVYCYEHGGVSFSTSPYSCRWDSGQVGYIYYQRLGYTHCERSKINEKYEDTMTDEDIVKILSAEIEELSNWANGNTFTFKLINKRAISFDSDSNADIARDNEFLDEDLEAEYFGPITCDNWKEALAMVLSDIPADNDFIELIKFEIV